MFSEMSSYANLLNFPVLYRKLILKKWTIWIEHLGEGERTNNQALMIHNKTEFKHINFFSMEYS